MAADATGPIREVVTDRAPAAIGPYSQAIVSGGWIYVSGQIPLDPGTAEVVGGDVTEQARRVLANVAAVLEEAGGAPSSLVKINIYLSDIENFSAVNEVYEHWLGGHRPARATVEVSGLPRGVDIEIDAVARVLD